jgi:hypothetical protein
MSFPTERITLNQEHNAAIRTGLNIVINEIAGLIVNKRRPPELLQPQMNFKYQPRAFDQELYGTLLSLRNRLLAVAHQSSSKHRLNCIELAIAAAGVRIGRKRQKKSKAEIQLDNKLENYRRRAQRSMVSKLGKKAYLAAQGRWEKFLNWIRFTALPLRVPRKARFRDFYRQQKQAMLDHAQRVISERCEKPIGQAKLIKMVELAIRELRRGRHPGLTVRALVASAEAAHDFLFAFIHKRVPELEIRFEYLTWCEQAAIRTEQFRKALRLPNTASEFDEQTSAEPVSETKIIDRVAKFFRDEIPEEQWLAVKDQSELLAPTFRFSLGSFNASSLEGVIKASKPVEEPMNWSDEIDYFVTWLLTFMFAINASSARAASLIRAGWVLALRDQPRLNWTYGVVR